MSLVSHFEQAAGVLLPQVKLNGNSIYQNNVRKWVFIFALTFKYTTPLLLKKQQEERKTELYSQNIGKVMEQSPCKASGCPVGQEVIRVLWNRRVISVFKRAPHLPYHKKSSLLPIPIHKDSCSHPSLFQQG